VDLGSARWGGKLGVGSGGGGEDHCGRDSQNEGWAS